MTVIKRRNVMYKQDMTCFDENKSVSENKQGAREGERRGEEDPS